MKHTLRIPIKWLGDEPPLYPSFQTPQSAGVDLLAHIQAPMTLQPMERKLIPTGIALALPNGFEAQVRPRSGLAWKHGLTVLNAPGTIDADYRGEIKVILINLSETPYTITPNTRIAQLVVAPVTQFEWEPVETLDETKRGEGDFGSTGTHS